MSSHTVTLTRFEFPTEWAWLRLWVFGWGKKLFICSVQTQLYSTWFFDNWVIWRVIWIKNKTEMRRYDTCSLITRLRPSLDATREYFRIKKELYFWLCWTWFGCVETWSLIGWSSGCKGAMVWVKRSEVSARKKASGTAALELNKNLPFNNPEAHTKPGLFKPLSLHSNHLFS